MFKIVPRYINKVIRQNSFELHQRKDIEVRREVLFFYKYTDEDRQDTIEEREDGENYEVEYNYFVKRFQELDDQVLIENKTEKDQL